MTPTPDWPCIARCWTGRRGLWLRTGVHCFSERRRCDSRWALRTVCQWNTDNERDEDACSCGRDGACMLAHGIRTDGQFPLPNRGDSPQRQGVLRSRHPDGRERPPVEGYALVVGINAKHSIKQIKEGVVKDAAAKGAELCKVVSGKINQELSGGEGGLGVDRLAGQAGRDLRRRTAQRHRRSKGRWHVKAQLLALSSGKWIEKSKLLEKTLKP